MDNIKFICFFFVLLFSTFFIGCNKNTTTNRVNTTTSINESTTKDIYIKYYDSQVLKKEEKYVEDNISEYVIEKEGFVFDSWYFDIELKVRFDESKINEYIVDNVINLYASWRGEMKDFNIEIIGNLENGTVINPIIKWDNPNSDSGYTVTIYEDDGIVTTKTLETNILQSPILNYGTSCKVEVKGNDSNAKTSYEFNVIENNDFDINRKITLRETFYSNMVIQRDEEIVIRGYAPEARIIPVKFGNEEYYGISNEIGRFECVIPAMEASFDPIRIVVGYPNNTITLTNVLIGDVYLFAGQSNMQWTTQASDYLEEDVTLAKATGVRFFAQNVVTSTEELDYVSGGKWFSIDSNNYKQFSAIAFMTGAFISEYAKENGVPIGILTAYQGDTNIANWMSREYYQGSCSTKYLHYNAMINPLKEAKIKGVVWYQGCNNSAAGGDYKDLLLSFFSNYRDLFNNDDLKFYCIGLACYDGDKGNNYDFSYVRESQALACEEDENAYFISTCDDGDPTFIHPRAKRYIALRVANSILSTIYSKDVMPYGPTYESHTIDGDTVTIEFKNSKGLYSKGDINNIYLAGADGKYYSATARIENDKLIVKSDNVENPVYVKYGFGKSPFVNIFNEDDYAITPFRTDRYDLNIDQFDYSDTSKYYKHPDGSNMTVEYVSDGIKITKANDGKTYGTIRLDKWGMISYNAIGFRLTVTGTNSNAKITFRAIEGPSYETWAYSFTDNFTGKRTFDLTISDFVATLNKSDNRFDTQCISYIELVIEASKEASITINEARFVNIERTKPRDFLIGNVSVSSEEATITLTKSAFAEEYKIQISETADFNSIVYENAGTEPSFKVGLKDLTIGSSYYIRAIASNELGETIVSNDAYVFYLNDPNKKILNNFDYENNDQLNSFIQSNMKVHDGLVCTLSDKGGINIESKGKGWQNFIFVFETGFNQGMSKFVFDADFSEYKGQIVMEIVTGSWEIFSYTLDLSKQSSGHFELNLSDFVSKNSGNHYNNEKLMWITFNFNDNVGGLIWLDDCQLSK